MTKKFITIALVYVSFFSFSAKIDSLLTPIIINNYNKSFRFNKYTTVYESTSNINLAKLINLINNNKLKPTSNNPTKGINKKYFWVFFKIRTNINLILKNSTTNIDKAYLFNIKNPSDTLVKMGTALKYSEKTINTEQVIFPIKRNDKEIIYVIKIIKLYDSLSFPMYLYSSEDYVVAYNLKRFLYIGFFTIMILLNIASIIFGITLKRKIFFYYSFYSLSVIIMYGTFKNVFSEYLYPEIPAINFYLKNISMLLVVSFNIFILKFININKHSKKIANIFRLMNIVSLSILVFSLMSPNSFRYYIFSSYYIIFTLYLTFVLVAMYILYRKKVENTAIFFVAFSPVVLATIVTILISFKILPSYLLSYDLPILGTIVEFIVFIIAILFEIKKLNDQRNILIKESSDNKRKLLMAFADGSDYASSFTSIELHDNIGSQLALLKHKLFSEKYTSLAKDIEKIKKDMQNISNAIDNKTVIESGFEKAIINFIDSFNKHSNIKAKVTITNFNDIKGDKSLQVLRVAQEALTNALKYSKAQNITVVLHNNSISIKDDGIGFNVEKLDSKITNGINNMKLRINNINGQLKIISNEGEGSEVKIILQ